MFIKTDNAAYTVRKNIVQRNAFIKTTSRSENATFIKIIIKHSTFNIDNSKRQL